LWIAKCQVIKFALNLLIAFRVAQLSKFVEIFSITSSWKKVSIVFLKITQKNNDDVHINI